MRKPYTAKSWRKFIGQDTNSSLTNEMMMAFADGREPKESEETK